MSTIKSSTEHLTLNADGAGKDIKFQANGVEKASIDSSGNFTSTSIDATKLSGALPAIDGSALTGSMGKVLQVKSFSTDSSTSTTSTSFVPTMLTLSITPTSASSKILILWDATAYRGGSATDGLGVIIDRDGSLINGLTSRHNMATYMGGASEVHAKITQHYLDAPNTITATTYTVKVKSYGGSTIDFGNGIYSQSTITLMEIGA